MFLPPTNTDWNLFHLPKAQSFTRPGRFGEQSVKYYGQNRNVKYFQFDPKSTPARQWSSQDDNSIVGIASSGRL